MISIKDRVNETLTRVKAQKFCHELKKRGEEYGYTDDNYVLAVKKFLFMDFNTADERKIALETIESRGFSNITAESRPVK